MRLKQLLRSKFAKPAIFGTGIALFVMIGILPAIQSLAQTDREIEQVQLELERQRKLFPLWVQLLQKSRETYEAPEPMPEPLRLSRTNTTRVVDDLQTAAAGHSIQVERITRDMQSMLTGSERLKVDARFLGRMADFQNLMTDINNLPYLERIERIKLETGTESRELRLSMLLWMRQE